MATPSLSPTGSPLGDDSKEGNGFTAVNGRTSPTANPKIVRISEESRPRSHHQDDSRRAGSNINDERAQRTNGPDNHPQGSPLNSSVKRRHSMTGMEEDESNSSGEEEEDDDDRSNAPPKHSRPPHGDSWNDRNGDDPIEARTYEALQRDRQQSSNGLGGPLQTDSPYSGPTRSYQPDEHSGIITTNAGVQMDPKKRKRAFTNRTKTGCQTCRRRKKKCDEGKPECLNCQRGGFICEGYNAKSPWPKISASKQLPTPIQARDSYGDPGNLHPRPPRNVHYGDSPNQPHPYSQGRPVTMEDEPEGPMRNQWPNSPYGVSPSQYPHNRDPSHGMPMQNHSLQMRDYDRGMNTAMHPTIGAMHNHSLHQQSPVVQAQQALQQQRQGAYIGVEKSEKEKMFQGELYKPYNQTLWDEREACRNKLQSFNTSQGVSREERARQLRTALESGSQDRQPNTPQAVGKGVFVEPPFRCDYGYNITIGNDVAIKTGCFISNPRQVTIGHNTFIGPEVQIMGEQFPFTAGERNGALHGKARGFKIRIGEGVNIGAGVKISPAEDQVKNGELVIGDGAYIPDGTVVKKNVPAYTIWGHKAVDEADVVRTLYGPEDKRPDQRRLMRADMG